MRFNSRNSVRSLDLGIDPWIGQSEQAFSSERSNLLIDGRDCFVAQARLLAATTNSQFSYTSRFLYLTIFINRFKHSHNILRRDIAQDVMDSIEHKSAAR